MKRFLRLLVVAACVWLFLFQGTSFSPVEELENVQSIKQAKVETLPFSPVLGIVLFIIGLYLLHRLIIWWSYGRKNYQDNVKMIDWNKYTEKEKRDMGF